MLNFITENVKQAENKTSILLIFLEALMNTTYEKILTFQICVQLAKFFYQCLEKKNSAGIFSFVQFLGRKKLT